MPTLFQAIVLGLVQGVSELFPISSLGHSVLVPQLLHWSLDESSPVFLPFLVATHLATALVLLGFFAKDWIAIISGVLRSLWTRRLRNDRYARIGWLLIASTIPAGILGLAFQDKVQSLFAAGRPIAFFLMLNGFLLLGAEWLRRRARSRTQDLIEGDERLARLSWTQAIGIGFAQAIALLPGFSRTGAALSGGLLAKLSHEDAARYAFLLATPIIFAASILKLPELATAETSAALPAVLAGAIAAAIAAYLSIRFLLRYFRTETLTPFAVYCILAGGLSLLLI